MTHREAAFWAVLALLLVGSLELASRGYWAVIRARSPFEPDLLLHSFYPELEDLSHGPPITRDDERFDILVLSGSTLHRRWGRFPRLFARAMRRNGRPFRVFNLAMPSHTTRDSYLKYLRIDRHRFDLVFVYHGINDLRADDVPPQRFREDYSHMDWYREVQPVVERRALARLSTLPFTARRAWMVFSASLGLREPVGLDEPHRGWEKYGGELRSVEAMRRNLEAIVAIAGERRDPVLLASFAWYVPASYSRAAFKARELDYAYQQRWTPLEVWGTAENVVRGLAAENRTVEAVARASDGVRFLDLANAVPREGRYFSDACHLSRAGMKVLVAALVDAALPPREPGLR